MKLLRLTKFGDIVIHERKGRYYVYTLETIYDVVKETYVTPLDNFVDNKKGSIPHFL
ncbi:MAG: putative integrase [Sulfolobus sp.]|nr:putative integrase [Sulfolobus sp.]